MQSRSQKSLWEKLARVNPLFYIASKFGREITEEQFEETSIEDFKKLIHEDDLIVKDNDGIWLDLGCGNGRITKWMAYRCKRVYGVDISGEMIRLANERMKGYTRQNITFFENDGEHILAPDNTFDFVFSYLVFQHIKTYHMIVNNFVEIARTLKPGGIFKVLLRKKQEPLKWWNGGQAVDMVFCKELAKQIGLEIIKTDYDDQDYTFWLWLKK